MDRISKEKMVALRGRVDVVGRKAVADDIGMAYSTLTSKLNDYIPTTVPEYLQIEEVVERRAAEEQV